MNTTIHQLRSTLDAARGDLKRLSITGTGQERRALLARVLEKERELASLQGRQHAAPLSFPIRWDDLAPAPHLLQNERRALLILQCAPADEAPGEVEPGRELALVELHHCHATRFGATVAHGHPLKGNGMEPGAAQEVINSEWIEELKRIHKTQLLAGDAAFARRRHYIFWFRDATFECIAEGFTVELYEGEWADLLPSASARLGAE